MDELIDLTRKQEPDSGQLPMFSFDMPALAGPTTNSHSRQGSADSSKQQQQSTPYYHFGERNNSGSGNKKLSLPATTVTAAGPPKPRRDWSSLTSSPPQHQLPPPPDYVNMRLGGSAQDVDSSSSSLHARQSSNDSSLSHGDSFLEQQMAKLLARKGEENSNLMMMKRSRSGDIPRPDSLSLIRSVSGELRLVLVLVADIFYLDSSVLHAPGSGQIRDYMTWHGAKADKSTGSAIPSIT